MFSTFMPTPFSALFDASLPLTQDIPRASARRFVRLLMYVTPPSHRTPPSFRLLARAPLHIRCPLSFVQLIASSALVRYPLLLLPPRLQLRSHGERWSNHTPTLGEVAPLNSYHHADVGCFRAPADVRCWAPPTSRRRPMLGASEGLALAVA